MKDAERIRGLGRSAGSALRVFEALRHRPVAGIDHLARHAGVSFPTASRMIESLERLGIVTESTGRRRNRVYSYEAFIAILSEERMAE
jgi:DNA-binding IclR family transcriptional regulator